MKKVILLPIFLIACSKPTEPKIEPFTDSTPSDTITMVEKTEAMLKETEGLEQQIKETYKSKETLLKENSILKQELKSIRDSLVEVKKKLPKKENFFQKVFNIKPDSITITTLDTIK